MKVEGAARACGEALHGLRCLIGEGAISQRPIQTEKAAGTLVANLVEMEMVCRHAELVDSAPRTPLWIGPG